MQFFFGAVCGVFLTILQCYAVVTTTAPAGTQAESIVNWDIAGRVANSIDVIREDMRHLTR